MQFPPYLNRDGTETEKEADAGLLQPRQDTACERGAFRKGEHQPARVRAPTQYHLVLTRYCLLAVPAVSEPGRHGDGGAG